MKRIKLMQDMRLWSMEFREVIDAVKGSTHRVDSALANDMINQGKAILAEGEAYAKKQAKDAEKEAKKAKKVKKEIDKLKKEEETPEIAENILVEENK